jgi:hypothetical protein
MERKKILVISFSPIGRDPRVTRQLSLLARDFDVSVSGYSPEPADSVRFIELNRPALNRAMRLTWEMLLLTGRFEQYYWNRPEIKQGLDMLSGLRFDLVVANDISALPLALHVAKGRPVLLDTHEYSPEEFADSFLWRVRFGRYNRYLCIQYMHRASATMTVCNGVADEYHRSVGIRPLVMENAAPFQRLSPSPSQPGLIKMIHHGGASRARHLDLMIDIVKRLDARFSLDFMLVPGDTTYISELKRRASTCDRIQFVDPVPMPLICMATNKYDLGLYLLLPTNKNHRFALPNKLFEFVQARLGVAIGPSPEMAGIVRQYKLGVVSESFDTAAMAASLNALTDVDITRFKQASHAAAQELSFEARSNRMLELVERLLSHETPSRPAALHAATLS